MLAFSPLASAPIADNGAGFRLVNIVTGTPVVEATAINQGHNFSGNEVAAGQPVLSTSDFEVGLGYAARSFTTGNPIVASGDFVEENALTATDITTGPVEVEAVDYSVLLSAGDITTDLPIVAEGEFGRIINCEGSDILSGVPFIGGTEFGFFQGHNFVGERLSFSGADISTGDFTEAETIPASRITARTPEVQSAVFSHQLSFVPDNITTGSVVVTDGSLSEEETLIPTGNIITGSPEVTIDGFVQVHGFNGEDLVSLPSVSITDMTMVETEILSAADITTGDTVVKVAYINGSLRRAVDIDLDTTNNVTFSQEYNIAV